ncbi:tRNA pseudouridine(38-40) synthase TruA, partial [Providencia rettgeri]|nr:tRNA pseudouridine(38-40) synthase TruA [Providencia rettgeri]
MRRIALGVCYEGTPWLGWQSQAGGNTVQDVLE